MVRIGGMAALAGVATFLAVVLALQVVQPDYRPAEQLMSELALGRYGGAMLLAFAGLAVAQAGIQVSVSALGAAPALRALLLAAAILFLAAGIFPLGETAGIHIAAIAGAFVVAVLAMYLFPSLGGGASALAPKGISWSAAAGVAAGVALGHSVLPMGVGQRMAAGFLLLWLLVVGWRLARPMRPRAMTPEVEQFWQRFLASSPGVDAGRFLEAFCFGDSERLERELTPLVLAGTKRATASLAWAHEAEGKPLPKAGDLSVVTDWSGRPVCVMETTRVDVVAFDAVTAEFAATEGEGDGSLEYWRRGHDAYFRRECARLGRTPAPDMPVVCERFRVVFRGV